MDVKDIVTHARCHRSRDRASENGFTVNELIVLLSVAFLIVALATPGVLRMRSQAKNEALAIDLLRTLAESQTAYSMSCGGGGYAVDFGVLAKPTAVSDDGYLPARLGETESPKRNGYTFTLDAGAGAAAGPRDCHGIPTQSAYLATAQPVTYGIAGTGKRSFAITTRKTIWQTHSANPPDEPFGDPETELRGR